MRNLSPSSQVNIVSFPATKVAALEHVGAPSSLMQAMGRFIAWRRQFGPSPQESATWNVFYNDPETASMMRERMDICASIATDVAPNDFGVITKVIPGGRCAVLRHRGFDDDVYGHFSWLLNTWLPASGERLRDAPCFVQRIAFFPDVPQREALSDLFVPLQKK